MILELSDQMRLRCLWYLLLKASETGLPLDSIFVVEVLGGIDSDLLQIEKVCKDNQLPNLRGALTGQEVPFQHVSGDILQRFKHGVSEFPPLASDEVLTFNFISANYCILTYANDAEIPSCLSAMEFWAALEWARIASSILDNLNQLLFVIVEKCFVADAVRAKGNLQTLIKQFSAFSSSHAYLIVYQRDFSEKLKGLRDLADYYRDEKDEVEISKGRSEALIENTRQELDNQIKNAVKDAENQARGLVEEAKGRYPENLLAGYVEQFEEDASVYGATSRQWLWGLVLSFTVTFLTAIHFLGHIQLMTLNPVGAFWDEILISVNYLIIWFAVTIGILVAAFYFSKYGSELDQFFKNGAGAFDGVLASLRSAFFVVMAIVPVMILIYLLSHYFHLRVDAPAVTAKTFLIPEGENINWAAMLSSAAPRVIILALASAVTIFCARMYGIQKNLQAINRYRATALASFVVFINAAGDESENAKERKDRLFDELATLIYSPIQTGFNRESKISPSELSELVTAVSKAVK